MIPLGSVEFVPAYSLILLRKKNGIRIVYSTLLWWSSRAGLWYSSHLVFYGESPQTDLNQSLGQFW